MLNLSFLLIWWSDCTGKSHHQSWGTISAKVVVDQLLLLTMVLLRTSLFSNLNVKCYSPLPPPPGCDIVSLIHYMYILLKNSFNWFKTRLWYFFLFYLESQNITQIKQFLSFFRMQMGDGQIFMLPRWLMHVTFGLMLEVNQWLKRWKQLIESC